MGREHVVSACWSHWPLCRPTRRTTQRTPTRHVDPLGVPDWRLTVTSKKRFLSRRSKPIRMARQSDSTAVCVCACVARELLQACEGQKQASLCRLPDEPLRCTASRRHRRRRTRPRPARICRLKHEASNQSCTTRELVGNNGTENALPVVIAFGLEQTATAPSVHGLAGGCQVAQRHFLCLQHQADLLNFPFPPLRARARNSSSLSLWPGLHFCSTARH